MGCYTLHQGRQELTICSHAMLLTANIMRSYRKTVKCWPFPWSAETFWSCTFSGLTADLWNVQAVDTDRWAVVVVLEVVSSDAAVVVVVMAVGAVAAGSRHGPLPTMGRQLAKTPIHTSLTFVLAVSIKLLQP